MFFFFSSRRRHTRFDCDWSSDVCSSDLRVLAARRRRPRAAAGIIGGRLGQRPLHSRRQHHHATAREKSVPVAVEESDRKSTRLNSSHSQISYAVFCLKKKKKDSALLIDA